MNPQGSASSSAAAMMHHCERMGPAPNACDVYSAKRACGINPTKDYSCCRYDADGSIRCGDSCSASTAPPVPASPPKLQTSCKK